MHAMHKQRGGVKHEQCGNRCWLVCENRQTRLCVVQQTRAGRAFTSSHELKVAFRTVSQAYAGEHHQIT